MARIVWDRPAERTYETGIDRGVLYLADRSGVPWNGLLSVEETAEQEEITPIFLDGQRYFNDKLVGDFVAVLKAYTYPDEFMVFDGYQQLAEGFYLDNQFTYDQFGLSYRTKVGNALNGDLGYKIHILYNLTALPETKSYKSMSDSPELTEFGWTIYGVPETVNGYRPTAHAVIDSRIVAPITVTAVENILYGTSSVAPRLPSLVELQGLIGFSLLVVDNGDGTFTITGPDSSVQIDPLIADQVNLSGQSVVDDGADLFTISSP